MSSRSDGQLRGEENPSTGECEPLEFNQTTGEVLNPCGLIANSQFNDSFTLCRDLGCNDEVTLNGTGIAWNIDRETRFVNRSEDFMVWMRVAAYRNWKKLYRKIEDDLEEGTYYIRVNSSYPVSGFGGKKFFYISETSWFGGPNLPLALAYIIVGSVSLLIAIFFGIYSRNTRDLELPPTSTVYLEGMVKNPIQQQHTDHMHQQHTTSV